jgi:hypothetical protein
MVLRNAKLDDRTKRDGGKEPPKDETAAEKRQRLEGERAGLQESIRWLETEIEKAERNADQADADAVQAGKEQKWSVAADYRGQAMRFRRHVLDLRRDLVKAQKRIREIDAELAQ